MQQKIVAMIPARGGSKNLPTKNIRVLCGKPLIAYSIEAAFKSKYIDRVVVSTEDERIEEISKKYVAEVVKRPRELAKDETPTIDVIFHMFNVLRAEGYSHDISVLLQPTSPLRDSEDIDTAIELFLGSDCESVIGAYETVHPPYWSFKIENNYLKPIFDSKYLNMRRQDLPKAYIPNGAIYISTPENLRKYKSFYCKKTIPFVMPAEKSIDIDAEMDFMLVESVMKKYETR